ncbi:hypothetical protein [Methanobrevibacter sp. UBA212]|uniref:hypothetical protein n=1 Tax=Methanobrevibacter sp. UBA212 TaxID=1915476 RepID=UPI0025CF4575|nr:hypothetical protein [Methanobrevibacter sp. UBA212]
MILYLNYSSRNLQLNRYLVNGDGLNVRIVRVGNIMARYSAGLFQKTFDTNAFLGELRAIKNIQAITEDMNNDEIEMSLIDYVAKATLALAKTPNECRVFNCVNPNIIMTSSKL